MRAVTDLHFLALDGGGTGCRAVLFAPDGRELARSSGGGANLTSDFETAHKNILATIRNTYKVSGLSENAMSAGIAVLGVAGAEIGDVATKLQARLGFAKSLVISDRETTSAGIIGQRDGTLAQIGTGSFFAHRQGGVTKHAGGWGLVLGDECSGAWLGRELLGATLRAHDGVAAASPLTTAVMTEFNGDPARIVLFARDAAAGEFASYAPRLFAAKAAGDAVADAILGRALQDLEHILTVMEDGSLPPLYLCGGVGEQYVQLVGDAFRHRITQPAGDGISGALSMAMAMAMAMAP